MGTSDHHTPINIHTAAAIIQPTDMPYNIILSQDPFDDTLTLAVKDYGSHTTMGLILNQCDNRNRPKIINIIPSQPCSRIKNWRTTIKHGYVTQVEEYPIQTISDIEHAVQECRRNNLSHITIEIALDIKPTGIHPTDGIPQLFADQLHIIQKHIHDIQTQHNAHQEPQYQEQSPIIPLIPTETDEAPTTTQSIPSDTEPVGDPKTFEITQQLQNNFIQAQHPVIRQLFQVQNNTAQATETTESKKFTFKQIKDDNEWIQSCYQQLDQYEEQDMFEKPQPKPPGAAAWPLVWTFIQKPPPDNRKKARCVIDGSKRWRKTITIRNTYANSLATDSERLFWALAAKNGLIVAGADVSNAFVEAPAPGDTFYIIPDNIFRQWWMQHKNRPPIPSGWVLKVKYALQGHPESPRLWERHITRILKDKLQFKATHHEPCLYWNME
jgi:hypothetical protein